MRLRILSAVLAVAGLSLVALALGRTLLPAEEAEPTAVGPCALVATSSGDDGGSGGARDPFGTVQRLVDALPAGETGCLAGELRGDVKVTQGDIRLRSVPGRRGTIGGRLEIADSADDVVVSDLVIDGSHSDEVTVQVFGDRVALLRNEITNRGEHICVVVGSARYGLAEDFVAERNRVYDCGSSDSEMHDHGFYLAVSRDARIVENVIYGGEERAGWGIHLYPDADGTVVARNVVDGNGGGIVIAGEGGASSDHNVVRDNVISNAQFRFNVEDYWTEAAPRDNLVEHNCVWNGKLGNFLDRGGYERRRNVIADPGFVDREGSDFRLRPGGPCAGMGP